MRNKYFNIIKNKNNIDNILKQLKFLKNIENRFDEYNLILIKLLEKEIEIAKGIENDIYKNK